MLSDEQRKYILGLRINNPGLPVDQLRQALSSAAWPEQQIQEGVSLFSNGEPSVQKPLAVEVPATATKENQNVPILVKVFSWFMLLGGISGLLGYAFFFLLGVDRLITGLQLVCYVGVIAVSFGVRHLRKWAFNVFVAITALAILDVVYLAYAKNLSITNIVGLALQLTVFLYLFSISEKFGANIMNQKLKKVILIIGLVLIFTTVFLSTQMINQSEYKEVSVSGPGVPTPISQVGNTSSTLPPTEGMTARTGAASSSGQSSSKSQNSLEKNIGNAFATSSQFLINQKYAMIDNKTTNTQYKDEHIMSVAPFFQYAIEYYKNDYSGSNSKYPQTLNQLFGPAISGTIPSDTELLFMMNSTYKVSQDGQDYELDVHFSTSTLKLTRENQISDYYTQ